MNLTSAFLLGTLQGVTEVLPISSSGHLVIAQNLLGIKEPELFFDVCLHIGSLIAVVAVFREEVMDLVMGGLRFPFGLKRVMGRGKPMDSQERMFLLVCVGTIPTVFVGLLAQDFLEGLFSSVRAVSINLIVTGTLLWLTRYVRSPHPKQIRRTRWLDALGVGLLQAIAIAPGISRSGSTITGGLFLGLDRDWAGRYSFLLFVPAVMGALILESRHVEAAAIQAGPTLVGIATAAVTGYISLKFLMGVVRKGHFYRFAPYCWILGVAALAWAMVHP